jgi:Lrp/AsnC family transcriptional regulator, leucine-responsive regulatory protein
LSGPAVAERLRRLEETGTLSYRAEVNPRALGYTLCAIVRISPTGGGLRLIPDIARQVPNITECYRITGEDCFFMKVYLHSIDDLEPVLDLFTHMAAPRPQSWVRRRSRPGRCPFPACGHR